MRQRIPETKFRVSLITAQGQPIEKVVDAPSSGDAIKRATQSFAGQQFAHVEADPLDPQLNIPTNQADQQNILPRQLAPLQPIKQLTPPAARRESIDPRIFSYPYSITLPSQFKKILHEVSPVPINESMGQYYIVLENKNKMREFLEKLNNNHDRDLAIIIVDGVRGSIS